MTEGRCLLADIGATRARFAAWEPGQLTSDPIVVPCADFTDATDAIRLAMERLGEGFSHASFGVASPALEDCIDLTNNGWTFSVAETRRRLGLARFRVINDFAALSLSLAEIPADDLLKVGGGAFSRAAPQAVLGPGTGLGVGALLPAEDGAPRILAGEGGYVGLPVSEEREVAAWQVLRARFGRVSAERVLCGSGLVELHNALCEIDGVAPLAATPADIAELGMSDPSSPCREVLVMFLALLGDVAGNVALVIGARGGVYLAGGVLITLAELLPQSRFRARFENKGRGQAFVHDIGTALITDRFAALKGSAVLAAVDDARHLPIVESSA